MCLRVLVRSFGKAVLWFGRLIRCFRMLAFGWTSEWVIFLRGIAIAFGVVFRTRLGVAECLRLGERTLSTPKRTERQRKEVYKNVVSLWMQRTVAGMLLTMLEGSLQQKGCESAQWWGYIAHEVLTNFREGAASPSL